MTAMTMEFDGVRELSMDEVDAVSGAGAAALARGVMMAMLLDHHGNQDGDAFDEGAAIGTGVTAGLRVAAKAGCASCGVAAVGAGAVTAGLVLADTFGT